MSDEADQRLILDAARTLFVNGEDTSGVLQAGARLGRSLGRDVRIEPCWGSIRLIEDGRVVRVAPVVPWAVNMRRVVGVLDLIDGDPPAGDDRSAWRRALASAAQAPAYDGWLFALASAAGAFGLTFLNGAEHVIVPLIAALAAGAAAVVRRGLAALGGNDLAQLFAATLLAGAVGGVATRCGVAFASGLVALGPLFVLVPGPALMGAALDGAALRIPLAIARLTFGLLCIAVLSAGVLIGAGLTGGVTPDPQMPAAALPLWADMLCAADASAAYAIFFVMPWRMMALPIAMGALSHGLRWVALNEWQWGTPAAAGIACLLVGIVVEPLCRRWRLPFAAVGFASVVAQVPGVFLFRMAGGLIELQRLGVRAPLDLLVRVIDDGSTAALTLVAMALGLTIPKSIVMVLRWPRAGFAP